MTHSTTYFEHCETRYSHALAAPSWEQDEQSEAALRHFNWLKTTPVAHHELKPLLATTHSAAEIEQQIRTDKHKALQMLGKTCEINAGQRFAFLTKDTWLTGAARHSGVHIDLAMATPAELLEHYLHSRAKNNKGLWITDWDNALPKRDELVEWMWELGLQHFELVSCDNPIWVMLLEATSKIRLLKPTWVHAFPAWYFDPAPEYREHGMSRNLRNGELARKERWTDCASASTSFKLVDSFKIDFGLGEKYSLDIPDNDYWDVVRNRVQKWDGKGVSA